VQSGLVDISNGVHQGSVLGPLLFIMYINDLPKSSAFYTVLYSDDTYPCLSHKSLDNLQRMVNVELIKVDNWLRSNKLSLNYSKSTFMRTKCLKNNSNLSETCSFQIKINDSCFQRKTCAKYLEILIDSSLDWSSHVQYIKSKLVRASHLFYKIRNVVLVDVLKMLYFSLAHCHLKYCIVSWGLATDSILQTLEIVHNNILRTITYNVYRCHITPLYKSLNSLKIHDIYKLELAKLMHKFHYEMLPTSFKDLFHKTAEIHCHDTRYTTNQNYFIQQVSTNAGKKQFLIEEQHIGQV